MAASATDRLHGRNRACHRTRAGFALHHVKDDHAKGRWPKRPPLHKPCFEKVEWSGGHGPLKAHSNATMPRVGGRSGHRSNGILYGLTQPAKFIWPFSILIMATGLIGLRSAPMEMVPETPW